LLAKYIVQDTKSSVTSRNPHTMHDAITVCNST